MRPLSPSPSVCIYAGQNVDHVIREFSLCADLVTPPDDLVAEARRILGKRVQEDGYVPPWRTFFGDRWAPEPPGGDSPSKSNGPSEPLGVVGQDVAEVAGPEYRHVEGIFHSLPPRHGGGGDSGMSPEAPLGTGRHPAVLAAAAAAQAILQEDEDGGCILRPRPPGPRVFVSSCKS